MNKEYPQLYIASAVNEFLKDNQFPVITITDLDSLRELVSYYLYIPSMDYPLIIEDLSFLPAGGDNILLKFIEECKLDIVVLSTYDKVNPILLSRFKVVEKKVRYKVVSDFNNPRDGFELIQQEDIKTSYTKYRKMAKISPILYYLDKKIINANISKKIHQFF